MEPRVTVITLGVSDLERAVAFYRDGIGWPPASVLDDVAFIDLDGVILALWLHRAMAADLGLAPEVGAYRGTALAHNVRSRAEVDAIFDHVRAAGATITRSPIETDWGGYAGYFADPDGHQWEIAHNPFWPLRPDGRVAFPRP